VLILGRALHAPWNEGTRVIGRNLARAASALRPVRVVSLTREQFRGQPGDDLPIDHIYTRRPYGARGDYTALPRIAQAIAALSPSHGVAAAHLVGLPLALAPWLRRRGARVVAHITLAHQAYRGPVERLRAAAGWRCFDRWVDAYACTSAQVMAELIAQGYPAVKLCVVPPPVDIERFRPIGRAAARHQLGLPQNAFLVAYIGTISPLRLPAAEVLRALHLAAADIPNLRLAVFAPVSTHPYNLAWAEGHVRGAAASSALPVEVDLRDLDEAQKAALYSAADVVLLPFKAPVAVEPPLTLLEAMACETAVVVAPYANRSQIVSDGWNGMIFSSPEELAARLRQLAALDAPRRAALGSAARASVEERHSFAAVAQAMAALWTALADTRGVGRPSGFVKREV
jgi:glycosyltransferase involved in cell wall biosynthesis